VRREKKPHAVHVAAARGPTGTNRRPGGAACNKINPEMVGARHCRAATRQRPRAPRQRRPPLS